MDRLRIDALADALEKLRVERVCTYVGGSCDCKYGMSLKGEQTGCPELRDAIALLRNGTFDANPLISLGLLAHLLPKGPLRPEQQIYTYSAWDWQAGSFGFCNGCGAMVHRDQTVLHDHFHAQDRNRWVSE